MPLRGSRRVPRRGPGLMGTVARTAAIAGAATAVSGAVQRRQADRGQGRSAQPPTGQPLTPAGDTMIDQLERLTKLKDQGALTAAEFETAKAKLLDS
jgi:hypothetical protein